MTGSNVHPTMFVPVDWSVSIGQILGIPFAATVNLFQPEPRGAHTPRRTSPSDGPQGEVEKGSVRQAIGIRTGFSAGHSTIKATGEYPLGGTIGFGYANGRFGLRWPGELRRNDSLVESVEGVSVGANAIIIDYDAKFYVGIGAAGFTADRYAGLSISIGVKRPPGTYTDLGELEGEWDGRDAVRLRAKPYIVVINPDGSTTVSGDIQPPDPEVTFELRRAQSDDSQTLQCP
ncbi:hypothetical protein AAH979_40655 [Plantactinospora sp. ZYX-F-223]|uniref:hypothetical protein n=1 Tax=Plantactinospora sp. ZYX-F-223 TaxID=3144103 RepID=UPI0031FE0187